MAYSKKGLTLWSIEEERKRKPTRLILLTNQPDPSMNGVYEAQLQQDWDSVLGGAGIVFAGVVPDPFGTGVE